jgi:hypothetical protein
MFYVARRLQQPKWYTGWARTALSLYHGIAYHQGKFGEMVKRFRGLKG